jgi:hypothetical protein
MGHGNGGFSGVFAEIGSSKIPYTTFRAVPISAWQVGESSTCRVGESAFECLKENSASRGVAMVSRGLAIGIF